MTPQNLSRLDELFNQIPKATKGTGANQYQEKVAEIPAAGKFSNDEPPAISVEKILQIQLKIFLSLASMWQHHSPSQADRAAQYLSA